MMLYRTPLTREKCEFTPPGKATESDELLIECDSKLANGLANTLYGYRVRRKIAISIEDNFHVWSLIPNQLYSVDEDSSAETAQQGNKTIVDIGSSLTNEIVKGNMIVVNDPRLSSLGLRIITDNADADQMRRNLMPLIDNEIVSINLKEYARLRFSLGVGEGHKDHIESNCLPLECNADFLGSLSFTKGCYLGQELTARIHYTGVVRKRLMPLIVERKSIDEESSANLPLLENSDIIEEASEKKVGVLRQVIGNRALALLRHDMVREAKSLIHVDSKMRVTTYIPYWWDVK